MKAYQQIIIHAGIYILGLVAVDYFGLNTNWAFFVAFTLGSVCARILQRMYDGEIIDKTNVVLEDIASKWESAHDTHIKTIKTNNILVNGICKYLTTMNKKDLIEAIDLAVKESQPE